MKSYNKQQNRIIFFITQRGKGNGGVESITYVIEKMNIFLPTVITNMDLPVNERWRNAGAEVTYWSSFTINSPIKLPLLKHIYQLGLWLLNNIRAYRTIRQLDSKVVHFNDIVALMFSGLGAKLAGAKVVFNIRDTKVEGYNLKWKLHCFLSDKIIVLSKEMKKIVSFNLGINQKSNKVSYIYSIVDCERFFPPSNFQKNILKSQLNISQDKIAIGYIASINSKKNQLDLIYNYKKLISNLPNSKLYLIGSFEPSINSYAESCQTAVQELKLENYISFVGYTSSIPDWYKAMDITIIVSHREGLARCMIESLACGVPVISFSVCSAKEILSEYNCGKVVPQGDYEQLFQAVTETLKNTDLYYRFQKNGLAVVNELFNQTNTNYYEKIYQNLFNSAKI